MNQLTTVRPDEFLPASPADSLRMLDEDGDELLQSEKAASSQKAYKVDARYFAAWCTAYGLSYLPATPQTVQRWITWQVRYRRLRPATIARRVAAIRHEHQAMGLTSPTDSSLVKRAVRAARRELGAASAQKQALTAPMVAKLLATCGGGTLIDHRDRAMLALGFGAALRRSELVAILASDLTLTERGMDVLIRRSKGDQEGQGVTLAVPHGDHLLPVQAVKDWLEASGITEGPVFRPIAKGSRLGEAALTAHAVAVVLKGRARKAGFDPVVISGHSLRAGYVTSCCEHGVAPMIIAEQTRHKSLDMLLVYSRRVDRYKNHSGKAFL